jgi:hypothetical protein
MSKLLSRTSWPGFESQMIHLSMCEFHSYHFDNLPKMIHFFLSKKSFKRQIIFTILVKKNSNFSRTFNMCTINSLLCYGAQFIRCALSNSIFSSWFILFCNFIILLYAIYKFDWTKWFCLNRWCPLWKWVQWYHTFRYSTTMVWRPLVDLSRFCSSYSCTLHYASSSYVTPCRYY